MANLFSLNRSGSTNTRHMNALDPRATTKVSRVAKGTLREMTFKVIVWESDSEDVMSEDSQNGGDSGQTN